MSREYIISFFEEIKKCISEIDIKKIEEIADVLHTAWKNDRQVFILGNGGSASKWGLNRRKKPVAGLRVSPRSNAKK